MNTETKYAYEKKIKELKRENTKLWIYQQICFEILDAAILASDDSQHVKTSFILNQTKRAMK